MPQQKTNPHPIGFIPVLPSTWLWALMLVTWFVALIVTPRFYR